MEKILIDLDLYANYFISSFKPEIDAEKKKVITTLSKEYMKNSNFNYIERLSLAVGRDLNYSFKREYQSVSNITDYNSFILEICSKLIAL